MELVAPYSSGWSTTEDPAWRDMVRRDRCDTQHALVRRLLLGWMPQHRRGQKRIDREYERQWQKKDLDKYAPPKEMVSGGPWIWGDDAFFLSNEGGSRLRLAYLMAAIDRLRPQNVLEIGCGNGVNLLPLACRFPDTRFAGLELTMSGVVTLRKAIVAPNLPDSLALFSPEPVVDSTAHRRIQVTRGSAGSIPFPTDCFDLVFTALALEQMEEIRSAALREITRVSSRHVLMLEPFAEVNSASETRNYIRAYDYFRGRIADLADFGLKPINVITNMPSKVQLRTALVVCKKANAS